MRLRLLPPLPSRIRIWDRRRRRAASPASVQETFMPVRAVSSDLVELDGGRGFRALYRVWGIDLATMDADEQAGWLAMRRAFLEHTTGFRIQELARSRRNRLEEYLSRSETLLEHGAEHGEGLNRQEVAVARERIAHLRRFAEEHFLTTVATYLVVPGATPDEAYERADAVEAWLDRLRLPYAQLHGLEIADLLADTWGAEAPLDGEAMVPLLGGALALPLAPDDPQRRRATVQPASPTLALLAPLSTLDGTALTPVAADAVRVSATPSVAGAAAGSGIDQASPGRSDGLGLRAKLLAGAFRASPTLLDHLAPPTVEVDDEYFRTGREYTRTIVVGLWPRSVTPGWLAELLTLEGVECDVSQTFEWLDREVMKDVYRVGLADQVTAGALAAEAGELADDDREQALRDLQRVKAALHHGDEEVFTATLTVTVRAESLEKLGRWDAGGRHWTGDTGKVVQFFRTRGGRALVARWEHEAGHRSTQPLGIYDLERFRTATSTYLAYSALSCTQDLSHGKGIDYGIDNATGLPVLLDPFDATLMANANTAVIAPSGEGKSYLTKLLELRGRAYLVEVADRADRSARAYRPEVWVVDPENEQRRLCEDVGGQFIDFGAGSGHAINAFDLPPKADAADARGLNVFADHIRTLLSFFEVLVGPLGQDHRNALERAIIATYGSDRFGITEDPATHWMPAADLAAQPRPCPLLRDLYFTLQHVEGSTAAELVGRLWPYVEGSLKGMFSSPTNVVLTRPFVVFGLRDVHKELRGAALHLVTAFMWGQLRRSRRPRLLVVDEAGLLLDTREGAVFLREMAVRIRKYWGALIAICQSTEQFTSHEHGQHVLKNCATIILKRQEVGLDHTAQVFRLTKRQREFLLRCGRDEALLLTPWGSTQLLVQASPIEDELVTSAPAQVALLEAARLAAPAP